MDYAAVREEVAKKIPNEYELVSVINDRVRQLEKKPIEGAPRKGTDLIRYVMQEVLDGKIKPGTTIPDEEE